VKLKREKTERRPTERETDSYIRRGVKREKENKSG